MPAELAAAMADMTGMDEEPADGVRRALGREPKDFAQYAREMAATGV
ncbi:hypothetical protein Q7689_03740 [Nocardiopsis tropica]|nr:hypothetical protein [Nocardiopsis tropica]